MKTFKMLMALASIVPASAVIDISRSHAQSFSFANAQIPSEMAICNSESLLVMDEEVAALISARIVRSVSNGSLPTLSREHSEWLKQRNLCTNDIPCLESVYGKRIKALTGRDL